MKPLNDGDVREVRPKVWHGGITFKVFAYRQDSETPYIILNFFNDEGILVFEQYLEDVYATEMASMITRGLAILPHSK